MSAALRVVPCQTCGMDMSWDDTPPRPCDDCLLSPILTAANNRDLLTACIHEPSVRYLWRCPRCVAERALLTAAVTRLQGDGGDVRGSMGTDWSGAWWGIYPPARALPNMEPTWVVETKRPCDHCFCQGDANPQDRVPHLRCCMCSTRRATNVARAMEGT